MNSNNNTKEIKFSIVICTYNREKFLPGLFDSILSQTLDKELFEIVLINNNSTDNTKNICLKFQKDNAQYNILYFEEYNQGLSYARNRGIKESSGTYITFADDDALLTPIFSLEACNYLDKHQDVGELGGPIKLKFLGQIPKWYNPWMASLLGYFVPSREEYTMTTKNKRYPRGSNMTFRNSVFKKCGDFNIKLGRVGRIPVGGEEKDLAFRIIDAGLKIVYYPKVLVLHLVPEERTTMNFIKNQAFGTGKSEKVRSLNNNTYSKRIFSEGIKWAATIVLWFKYMIILKPVIANTLVKFRFWVTMGLLQNNNSK